MKTRNYGRGKIVRQRERRYRRKEPMYDYLKWFRVVRRWAEANYNIGLADLEMLFFLYDFGLFTYYDFKDMNAIFTWDKKRFARLKSEGWIDFWGRSEKGIKMYEVSYRGKKMINGVYKKLNMEEEIAESTRRNVCAKRSKYSDKVTMNMIEKFNEEVRTGRVTIRKPDE